MKHFTANFKVNRIIKSVILLMLTCIFNFTVSAEMTGKSDVNDTDMATKMDQLLMKSHSNADPGISVLIVKEGRTILRKAYGMANLELQVKLRPEMVFRIGSVTKQFTAVAIIQLMERGQLKLSDELTKYLPNYPTKKHKITIEHLLTHTSGIKSYTDISGVMHKLIHQSLSVDELVDTFKHEPLAFPPGTSYSYSNSGYALLGIIIEKVSGKTYQNYIQDEIFTPLNMQHSYYGSFTKIIPNRVTGYVKTTQGFKNASHVNMSLPYSAGALLSTLNDLKIWQEALFEAKLVSAVSLKKMITPFVLTTGQNADSDKTGLGYGYGLRITEFNGHKVIGHSGVINGFLARIQHIADESVQVYLLANNENPSVDYELLVSKLSSIAMNEEGVVLQ
jgi:D-alanyl-D-alanine carboxypeptidase